VRVLFIAAEAAPLVKVGGLGDVAGSLPPALRALNADLDVRLALPLHGAITKQNPSLKPVAAFTVITTDGPLTAQAFETRLNGVPTYLIGGAAIPPEAPIYSPDAAADGHKYTFFSLAALELTRVLGWRPDVVHAHDWHTAPAIYYLSRIRPYDDFFARTATLITVHNLPYMGQGASPALDDFGLPPALDDALPAWARHLPLPLGLLAADAINTVSPTYAREILTPEYGCGLENFLRSRASRLHGILNGLDTRRWNPRTDPHIVTRYGLSSLERRAENKRALQSALGLPEVPETPLLAMVTRLDPQKGVDIAVEALQHLRDHPWQAVFLGTGDPQLESLLESLAAAFPDRVRVRLEYNAPLGRQIYASADVLLIPSRYEPCGLAQMIAMRYGCTPVARETGGLADTVHDPGLHTESTGFLFPDASPTSLAFALRRAFACFRQPRRWRAMQRRGMRQDFSWRASAEAYRRLYQQIHVGTVRHEESAL